jgi:hypothetical protein
MADPVAYPGHAMSARCTRWRGRKQRLGYPEPSGSYAGRMANEGHKQMRAA